MKKALRNNHNILLYDQMTVTSKKAMNIELVQKAIKWFPIYVHEPEIIRILNEYLIHTTFDVLWPCLKLVNDSMLQYEQ